IDSGDAAAPARKAMVDWPEKRDDLQRRLDSVKDLEGQGQKIWESSAGLRATTESAQVADADIESLLSQADRLDHVTQEAKGDVSTIDTLAGQLYVSWDKLLLDVDKGQEPREKVRIVRIRFPDATLTHGDSSSEERWEPLERFGIRDADASTGMV